MILTKKKHLRRLLPRHGSHLRNTTPVFRGTTMISSVFVTGWAQTEINHLTKIIVRFVNPYTEVTSIQESIAVITLFESHNFQLIAYGIPLKREFHNEKFQRFWQVIQRFCQDIVNVRHVD
jgi:hypothetical protein